SPIACGGSSIVRVCHGYHGTAMTASTENYYLGAMLLDLDDPSRIAGYAWSLSQRRIRLPWPSTCSATRRLKAQMIVQRPIVASTLLYAHHPRRDAFRSIAEAGFEQVDLWMYPDIAQHMDPETDALMDVRRDLDEFGLTVPIVSFHGAHPHEPRFRLAAELGARMIVRGGIDPMTQRE